MHASRSLQKTGLGENSEPFYTNMCGSMKNALKSWTDYKEHKLHPFVNKMYAFVESQGIDSILGKFSTVCGRGCTC